MNITGFIENNYDIIWRHPESVEEETDTYLIAEKRNSSDIPPSQKLMVKKVNRSSRPVSRPRRPCYLDPLP